MTGHMHRLSGLTAAAWWVLVVPPGGLAVLALWSVLASSGVAPALRTTVLVAVPCLLAIHLILVWALQWEGQARKRLRDVELVRLERTATSDTITELGNHRAFQDEFGREVRRAIRHGYLLSLALIDIEEFHTINARHGAGHGDRVLARLGGVLNGRRAEDRAFRIGADDFALILPYTGCATAKAVLLRLMNEAEHSLLGATIRAGVAELDSENMEAETLLEQARAALQAAALGGRERILSFADVTSSAPLVATSKASAVRMLIAEERFAVVFQPVWRLDAGTVLGFEAICRPHPDYGLSGPTEAFNLAERLGRSYELDAICRRLALERVADLPAAHLLFLNVAPLTLEHGLLPGRSLVEAVEQAGLSAERVVLELPEPAVDRFGRVAEEAIRLRGLGFKLALDDAGTSRASLDILSRMPVDYLKIDGGVVARALADPTSEALLTALTAFAGKLHTFVIAEGTESPSILAAIRSGGRIAGIHGAQGFLLGAPVEDLPSRAVIEAVQVAYGPK